MFPWRRRKRLFILSLISLLLFVKTAAGSASQFNLFVPTGENPHPNTLILNQENSAPVAQPDSFSIPSGWALYSLAPGVLVNDSDPDQDSLTALLVNGPDHGTFELKESGYFYYEPDPGFLGTDSFSYQAFDGQLASDPVSVGIKIEAWESYFPTVIKNK